MQVCSYCGHVMVTVEQSAKHPFECYGARKAYDDKYQSELTQAIKELTKVIAKLDKKL